MTKTYANKKLVSNCFEFWSLKFGIYLGFGICHPPSPETTGMPVEESEKSSAATADSACANCRADEPGEVSERF